MQNTNTKILNDTIAYGTGIYTITKFETRHIPFLSTLMSKKELKKIEIKYKETKMPRDNNSPENHKRGLEKRIANYATQHTLRTMDNSPMKVALAVKQNFYRNWMNVLGLK